MTNPENVPRPWARQCVKAERDFWMQDQGELCNRYTCTLRQVDGLCADMRQQTSR